MLYKDIQNAINSLANDLERIRKLSSPTGDESTGIIDGAESGTDVNKEYFERDMGIYDALIALFNLFGGRDNLAGGVFNLGSTVFFESGLNAVGSSSFNTLIVNGAADFKDKITIAGELKSNGGIVASSDICIQDRYSIKGVNTRSATPNVNTGDKFDLISLDDEAQWDIYLNFPDNAEYYRNNTGGNFKIVSSDDCGANITVNGFMSLGYCPDDTHLKAPDIDIQVSDDRNSNKHAGLRVFNKPEDNPTDCSAVIMSALFSELNGLESTSTLFIKATSDAAENTWTFESVVGAPALILKGNGDATFNGNASANVISGNSCAIIGTLSVGGLATFGSGIDVTGSSSFGIINTGTINSSAINASSNISSIGYGNSSRLKTIASGAVVEFDTGSNNSRIGNDDGTSEMLSLSSTNGTVIIYKGVLGIKTGRADLRIVGDGQSNVPSIEFAKDSYSDIGSKRMFIASDGSVNTTIGLEGDVGDPTTGASIVKGNIASSVDVTDQTALNSLCSAMSEEVVNAVVVVRDSNDSLVCHVIYNGSDWEVMK